MYKRLMVHRKEVVGLAIFLVCATWYVFQTPSNERDWSLDHQVLPSAEFRGDEVAIANIRNFTYRSKKDYDPAYYDKVVDLRTLRSVDYIVEPLEGIGAAHTFLSFGFEDGSYIAISVEIRKEKGETFSPWKGVLRQYELMYVVADERDVIALRANHRKDTVYLYPVSVKQEVARQLFVDMLTRANTLREQPEFYNTITNTCTTNIATHINAIAEGRIPWDVRLLFPKYSDALAYSLGLLDTSVPLEELRKRHKVNDKAERFADAPDFSKRIRE